METWAAIWKLTFIVVMAIFTGMSVWVIIGGWQDVRKLLAKLSEDSASSDSDDQSSGADD